MKTLWLIAGLLLLLAIAAAVWGVPWVTRQIEVDRCLDRGGRWDPVLERCETAP